ncbi:hypothetical protein D3C87_163130 [compost metagenome]
MKPLYAFLYIILMSAPAAKADFFTIIRDGQEYRCTAQTPRSPEGAMECVNDAYRWILSKEEAFQLCQGAYSKAPASCAKNAFRYIFDRTESIELCQGSRTDTGPVDCAKKAFSWILSREEALHLCKGNGSLATVDCVKKAYSGIYSKEEAIRLCKSEPLLVMQTLKLVERSVEFHEIQLQKKKKEARPLSTL